MKRRHLRSIVVAIFATLVAAEPGRASSTEPAALLIFPLIEIDVERGVDTLLQVSNTSDAPIGVHCIYQNRVPVCVHVQTGETLPGPCLPDRFSCTGRCRERESDTIEFFLPLTARQPLGWRVSAGREDFLFDEELPDLNGTPTASSRIPALTDDPFLGVLHCFGLDGDGTPSERNVLIGSATIETRGEDGTLTDTAQYNAEGLAADAGAVDDNDLLVLGGRSAEYEGCPAQLVLPNLADLVILETEPNNSRVETRIVLAQCSPDLSAADADPSIAQFVAINEFAQRFTTSTPVDGQHSTLVSNIDGAGPPANPRSIFSAGVVGSVTQQVFIRSVPPFSGLVGIAIETHRSLGVAGGTSSTAVNLQGEGAHPQAGLLGLPSRLCFGDCDLSFDVTIDEVVLGLKIALGDAAIDQCPGLDIDRSATATVEEVVAAVGSSLNGCRLPAQVPDFVPPLPSTPDAAAPEIAHLGVASADDFPLEPSELDDMGRPVYVTPVGHGFTLVTEVRRGQNGQVVGQEAFRHDPEDPTVLPDLQLIVSRPLGDGSLDVCDTISPDIGGVPATQPFAFAATQEVADAVNDAGCRVDDGMGRTRAHRSFCTKSDETRVPASVSPLPQRQFCLPIAKAWEFPAGETVVAVRARDVTGEVGPVKEMVVRVLGIR